MTIEEEKEKYIVKTDLTPIGEFFSSLNKNELADREYRNNNSEKNLEGKLLQHAPEMVEKFFGLPKESFCFKLDMSEEEMFKAKIYNLISEIRATSDLFLSPDWKIGELSIMISPHHIGSIECYNDYLISAIDCVRFEFKSNWGERVPCNNAGDIVVFFQKN